MEVGTPLKCFIKCSAGNLSFQFIYKRRKTPIVFLSKLATVSKMIRGNANQEIWWLYIWFVCCWGNNVSQWCVTFLHLDIKRPSEYTKRKWPSRYVKKKKKKLIWKFEGTCLWYVYLHWMKPKIILYQISVQCSTSLPPENIRKPKVFYGTLDIRNNKDIHLEYSREVSVQKMKLSI